MNPRPLRVCPACRRPARTRPLPPDGFWQEHVLQRLGMYPYRCEACGARFYRRVKVADRVAPSKRSVHPMPPRAGSGAARAAKPPAGSQRLAQSRQAGSVPKILSHSETEEDSLSHEDFIDLIDHMRRAEERKGLKTPGEHDDQD